jgi:hypothetical protein
MKNLLAPFILMLMLFVHVTAALACAPPPPGSASFTGPASSVLCTGTPYVLTNTSVGTVSYIWLNNANGQMTISSNTAVNPTITFKASGIYTVTLVATDSFNQNTSATATYTVVGPTVGNYAGSNKYVCGPTGILSIGSNPVSGYSYSWSPSTGLNDSTIAKPTVSLSNTTTYILKVTNAGCSYFNQVTIYLNSAPAVPTVFINSPVCQGETILMQASSTTPGADIIWITGSGIFGFTTFNGPSYTIPNAQLGFYSINVYSKINGCKSIEVAANCQVNPKPLTPGVDAREKVCIGEFFNLKATTIDGASYQWWGPNGFTSTSQNPLIFASDSTIDGDYWVVAVENGCESARATTLVLTEKVPIPAASSNSPVYKDSYLQLSANSTAMYPKYIWTGPNMFISFDQNPKILVRDSISAGMYYLSAISNGCTSDVARTYVVVIDTTTTAVDPATALDVSLYPNPSTGQSTLKLGQSAAVSLTLNNALGQQVREYHFAPAEAHELNFVGLPAGVYLLNGRIGGSTYQQRVVLNP